MKSVSMGRLCTGCGTCIALCPRNAITLNINRNSGIYEPQVDKDKCNDCRICHKVCPSKEIDLKELNLDIFSREPDDVILGNYENCYVGYSTNNNVRYNSSSGGLVTQILIFALEEGIIDGALVTRMNKNKPLEPEPFIARCREDIIDASRSKYCPVPANIAIRELLKSKDGEKFAVVGLPCHIHGIRKAERLNSVLKNKIILHLGLICNHTPSFLATKYLIWEKKIREDNIVRIDYRGEGWQGTMRIVEKNLNETSIPQFSFEYWGCIFNTFFFPYRCTLCDDKVCMLADASFADAWVPEIMQHDNIGTSLVISRKKTFEDILNKATEKGLIQIKGIDAEGLIASQGLYLLKRRFSSRLKIAKVLGQEVPLFNLPLAQTNSLDHICSCIFYLRNSISYNPRLWNAIKTYSYILRMYCALKKLKPRL